MSTRIQERNIRPHQAVSLMPGDYVFFGGETFVVPSEIKKSFVLRRVAKTSAENGYMPNVETLQAIEDSYTGRGVTSCATPEEMYTQLGI